MRRLTWLTWCFAMVGLCTTAEAQTLEGFASFPADTFAPGPTSGQFIAPANGRVPPFAGKQPVQGVSSVLRGPGGDYWIMADNGFGAKENSPDFVLRMYRISPDFRTADGGSGAVALRSVISLRDPRGKINFPIVAEQEFYPGSTIPVDPEIRANRLLTGGDFDIESVRVAADGTLWFGDEFGPFLIHTDAIGRVLEAPYPLPGVKSPQNPFLAGGTPNLPRSKGFEGMAIAAGGGALYPMLEGALTTDPDQRRLIINEFDLRRRQYTNCRWFYRLESPANAIGDLTAIDRHRLLVIERDNAEGPAAAFKKIYAVDFRDVGGDGFLVKRQVADLLNIDDPDDLGGFGPTFRFPFQTIESVMPLDNWRLAVLNDNNYPFSAGRMAGSADPNEIIIIRVDHPLTAENEHAGGQP